MKTESPARRSGSSSPPPATGRSARPGAASLHDLAAGQPPTSRRPRRATAAPGQSGNYVAGVPSTACGPSTMPAPGECQFQHGQQRPGRTAQPGQARGQPEQGQGRQRLAAQARLAGQVCDAVSRKPAMIARPKPNSSSWRCQPSQPPPVASRPGHPVAPSATAAPPTAPGHIRRENGRKARRNSGTIAIAARRSSTCIKPTLPSGRPGDGRHAANEIPGHHRPLARSCRCRKSSLPGMRRAVVPAVLSGSARAVPRCPIAIWSGHKPAGRGSARAALGFAFQLEVKLTTR